MNLNALILKMFGWKVIYTVQDFPKCVICIAPHTSNWDFILARMGYFATGNRSGFLMKKEWFFFPLGNLFRAMGGVPVERGKRTSITDQIATEFSKHDYFHIGITPEGTRKPNPRWKLGFYHIALKAGVPIQLGYLDYAKKEVGITKTFHPTGDVDKDMLEIKSFYKDVTAKKPENFKI